MNVPFLMNCEMDRRRRAGAASAAGFTSSPRRYLTSGTGKYTTGAAGAELRGGRWSRAASPWGSGPSRGCESLGIRAAPDRAAPAALDTRGFMLMQISLNGIQLLSPGSPRTFGT